LPEDGAALVRRKLRVVWAVMAFLFMFMAIGGITTLAIIDKTADEHRDDIRAALIETCQKDNERWARFRAWIETIQLGILDPVSRQQLLDAVAPVDCKPPVIAQE
jgi:hypothetical protein